MIETSSEQINDQNHDHHHDSITSKELKKLSNTETEEKVYFRKVHHNHLFP